MSARSASHRPVRRPRATARKGWIALTGTPGTGKSSVARRLPPKPPVFELGSLAIRLGAGHRIRGGSVQVDLDRLRRAFRSLQRRQPPGVVVGHLAHLLPVSYAIVLRCHPRELARRLRRSHRTAEDRAVNVLAEALDVVLVEALTTGLPVHEVDTTGRSIEQVARSVAGLIRRPPRPKYGRTNWLADPRVTAQLLRKAR